MSRKCVEQGVDVHIILCRILEIPQLKGFAFFRGGNAGGNVGTTELS